MFAFFYFKCYNNGSFGGTSVRTDDFDYELPEELIAQEPIEKRDESRLMVLDKETGEITHSVFHDITDYLQEGDVLVLNDTKVLPARIIGEKEDTKAVIELLLLKNIENNNWECLVKPAKRVHLGTIISFGDGLLKAECIKVSEEGIREFKFIYEGIFYEVLDKLSNNPYIGGSINGAIGGGLISVISGFYKQSTLNALFNDIQESLSSIDAYQDDVTPYLQRISQIFDMQIDFEKEWAEYVG